MAFPQNGQYPTRPDCKPVGSCDEAQTVEPAFAVAESVVEEPAQIVVAAGETASVGGDGG